MSKQKKNKKRGRPREKLEDKIDFKLVEKYAALGLTDEEVGFMLNVTEQTVNRWKKNPQFLLALKNGKLKSDARVVESLYKRANGYTYDETTKEHKRIYDPVQRKFHYMLIVTKIVTKRIAPDVLACNSWLNNRRRDQWSYNPKPSSSLSDQQQEKLRTLLSDTMVEEM